jgi:hypothetical protein
VEILAIVLLHTMKASADDPSNITAKEIPPVKAELATKQPQPHILLSTLK